MANWSQNFTVKSNARRGARKAGVDPSKVQPFVKAGKTLYRFPMPATASTFGTTPEGDKTRAALKRIAKSKKASDKAAAGAKPAKVAKPLKPTKAKTTKASVPKASKTPPAGGSKFDQVAAMLRAPGGASMTAIVEATGWKPHTARARISVDVSKRLNKGEEISRRRDGGVSHYSIVKSKQMDLPIGEAA